MAGGAGAGELVAGAGPSDVRQAAWVAPAHRAQLHRSLLENSPSERRKAGGKKRRAGNVDLQIAKDRRRLGGEIRAEGSRTAYASVNTRQPKPLISV